MKTKKSVSKFASSGMLLILVLLFVMSCKKTDDTPEPTPPPPTPGQKAVFTDNILRLKSDYEVRNYRSLQAFGTYYHINKGFGGPSLKEAGGSLDMFDWFDRAYGLFSAINDFKNVEEERKQFAKIDSSLGQIQNEIGELQTEFNNLITELNYDKIQLMNEIYDLNEITATAPIITAFSDADRNGFLWYSNESTAHSSGSYQDSLFIKSTLNPEMINFAMQYTSGSNATTLRNSIVVLNGYLLPSSTSPGLLSILSRNIVAQNKTAPPLSQYMVLENYFLQIINYQFQAAIVQLNCFKVTDTLSYLSFKTYMQKMISSEVTRFLQATNFMAVSLVDYRNQAQYNIDVPDYLYTGIAPETTTQSMMARAQFAANLITKACGIIAPVMCGSIILPHYYNAGTGNTPLGSFDLYVGGEILTARTDTVIKSPIPYSYYNLVSGPGQNSSVAYDNQWNVFNYGKFGTAEPVVWQDGTMPVQIYNAPWGNQVRPLGSITPKWYNPRNPSEISATETDSCTMQFAYFSASWKWGYLGACLAPPTQRSTSTLNDEMTWQDHNPPACPFVQQWHSSQHKFETSGGGYTITYNYGCLFQENFSGDFGTYSSGWIYASEFSSFPLIIPSDMGSGLSLFIKYNYTLTSGWAIGFNHYSYKIGTGVTQPYGTGGGWESTGDIVNTSGYNNGIVSQSGSNIMSVGTGGQNFNFEIIMGMSGLSNSTSFSSKTYIYPHYVFKGRATNY